MINFVHCNFTLNDNISHHHSCSVELYVKQNKKQIYHKLKLHHICFLVVATHYCCMLFTTRLQEP